MPLVVAQPSQAALGTRVAACARELRQPRKQTPQQAPRRRLAVTVAAAAGAGGHGFSGFGSGAAAASAPTAGDGKIESELLRLFRGHNVDRVVASLRRTLSGAPDFEALHPRGRQSAHAYVEGLSAAPFYEVDDPRFAWVRALEGHAPAIAAELAAWRAAGDEEELRRRGNRIWSAAAREEAVAYGPQWRTLVLQDRSRWDATNAALFPKTVRAVREAAAAPSVECFFARQAPGSGIAPHSDGCNFIMTAHLGLDVPEGKCWIKVGDEQRPWMNGKGLVFDTSFIHETFNEAAVDRTVLLLRFWHPELTPVERLALQFVFDSVDQEKAAARDAEKALKAMAAGAGKAKKGFGARGR